MEKQNILIIGGGIIGSTAAYYLAKSGAEVTVIDKGAIGHGCSYGNAGWIVPAHAVPLPAPGAVKQGLKWMFDKDSPLYIKPRLSAALVSWLWNFSRFANARHQRYGAGALMGLSHQSLELYKQFSQDYPQHNIHLNQRGLLQACQSADGVAHTKKEAILAEAAGLAHQQMTAEKIKEFEPALQGELAGGAFLPDSADAEPLATVQGFTAAAKAHGAVFKECVEVFGFERSGGKIQQVLTTSGPMAADHYILATGSWSSRWAKSLDLNIPIQGGKGYALILDPIDPMPRGPILLVESKVAVTPRQDSLRLAGTMEINALDESITMRRVDAILTAAKKQLNIPDNPRIREVWRGLRPCSPDGLPIIGQPQKYSNLTLATGHAMLGLTMAAGTGKLVSDLLNGQPPQVDPKWFTPDRF